MVGQNVTHGCDRQVGELAQSSFSAVSAVCNSSRSFSIWSVEYWKSLTMYLLDGSGEKRMITRINADCKKFALVLSALLSKRIVHFAENDDSEEGIILVRC